MLSVIYSSFFFVNPILFRTFADGFTYLAWNKGRMSERILTPVLSKGGRMTDFCG